MFIFCRIGVNKLPLDVPRNVIDASNKIHACYKVSVEWDSGGLKQKIARLMKLFDATNHNTHTCSNLVSFDRLSSSKKGEFVARGYWR